MSQRMEPRSQPKEDSGRNRHWVKVIWRGFFVFFFFCFRRKGKLSVSLGWELFLCCSSAVFILISETQRHVCPPKQWSLSSTTLVPTAESVCCQGGKGTETVGPQWEACGKKLRKEKVPTDIPEIYAFTTYKIWGEQQTRKGIFTVMR